MTPAQVRARIRREAKPFAIRKGSTGITAWGKAHGVARGHLSEFMAGKRLPTTDILQALGLRWTIEDPRAAAGEQSRSRRLTEEEARELVGFKPETILTCLREWGYVEDAALQTPPAKVEG